MILFILVKYKEKYLEYLEYLIIKNNVDAVITWVDTSNKKWIQEKTTVDQVLRNIKMAFFDPSFYDSYEHEITKEISKSISDTVRPESIRYNDVHSFLKSG